MATVSYERTLYLLSVNVFLYGHDYDFHGTWQFATDGYELCLSIV